MKQWLPRSRRSTTTALLVSIGLLGAMALVPLLWWQEPATPPQPTPTTVIVIQNNNNNHVPPPPIQKSRPHHRARVGQPDAVIRPYPVATAKAAMCRGTPPFAPRPPPRGTVLKNRPTGVVHVVMQFPNIMGTPHRAPTITARSLQIRQDEYALALWNTLRHPGVAQVHVLLNQTRADLPLLLDRLDAVIHGNDSAIRPPANDTNDAMASSVDALTRLRVFGLGHFMVYADAFLYANEFLPAGTVAMVMNSDVYPVHGIAPTSDDWSLLRPAHFHGGKTGFMLSRYEPPCPTRYPRGRSCREAARVGSADAFVFLTPVPERVVGLANFPTHWWGAENRAGAALVHGGGTPGGLTNPCTRLPLEHAHCSGVRTARGPIPRINRGAGHSVVPRWVDRLPRAERRRTRTPRQK